MFSRILWFSVFKENQNFYFTILYIISILYFILYFNQKNASRCFIRNSYCAYCDIHINVRSTLIFVKGYANHNTNT